MGSIGAIGLKRGASGRNKEHVMRYAWILGLMLSVVIGAGTLSAKGPERTEATPARHAKAAKNKQGDKDALKERQGKKGKAEKRRGKTELKERAGKRKGKAGDNRDGKARKHKGKAHGKRKGKHKGKTHGKRKGKGKHKGRHGRRGKGGRR